jgi:hypothetical protein
MAGLALYASGSLAGGLAPEPVMVRTSFTEVVNHVSHPDPEGGRVREARVTFLQDDGRADV